MITNRLAPRPGDRVLLAGDAASLINPLTGEGIFYALLSGRRAGAAAVERDDPSAVYRAALAHELGRHLRHTTVLTRLTADRRMLKGGGFARPAGPPGAFDARVEVGLGRGLIIRPR